MGRRLRSLLTNALLVTALLAPAASARQEQQPGLQGKLIVEVEYMKGAPLAYEKVPGGSWYGRFGRVRTPQPRAASDTVLAVDVQTRLEGRRVEIKVGVRVGEKHFDRLDAVATYTASEGEAVVARDLERVGVAPFSFKVLRVNEAALAPPLVVNKTQSISASVAEFHPMPLPRVRLTLTNLSSKGVRAVYLRQVVGGRERTVSYAMEHEGKILIEPGGTYDKVIRTVVGESSSDNFTPASAESVVVAAVVFDDYTFEGEPWPAATKRAFDEGERLQLRRIIPLLGDARAAGDAETPEAVRSFAAKLSAMDDNVQQSSVDAILKSYPDLNPTERAGVRPVIESSMHRLRRELLDGLAQFEKNFSSAPGKNSFNEWLAAKQAGYQQWLSRL